MNDLIKKKKDYVIIILLHQNFSGRDKRTWEFSSRKVKLAIC